MAQEYPAATHLPSPASTASTATIRINHCYKAFPCDFPDCMGEGSRFAIDLYDARVLAHYCEAHTDGEIRDQWRELSDTRRLTPPLQSSQPSSQPATGPSLSQQRLSAQAFYRDDSDDQRPETDDACDGCYAACETLQCSCGEILCHDCMEDHWAMGHMPTAATGATEGGER